MAVKLPEAKPSEMVVKIIETNRMALLHLWQTGEL